MIITVFGVAVVVVMMMVAVLAMQVCNNKIIKMHKEVCK